MSEIITTNDGSHTLINEQFNEHYHSQAGAILESQHVYINAGFRQIKKSQVAVFDVGFGTGLNALLTLLEAQKTGQEVYYESIELYPIDLEMTKSLNYPTLLNIDNQLFERIHLSHWGKTEKITPQFTLHKVQDNLLNYNFLQKFDVVYFDAFSPNTQPELWGEDVLKNIYNSLNNNGLLTTYSSKGSVKQNLRSAGFNLQRLPGAGGKHHMLRAIKSEGTL